MFDNKRGEKCTKNENTLLKSIKNDIINLKLKCRDAYQTVIGVFN